MRITPESCVHKTAQGNSFAAQALALNEIDRLMALDRVRLDLDNVGRELAAFQCRHCRLWHVGSLPRGIVQRRNVHRCRSLRRSSRCSPTPADQATAKEGGT